MSTDNNDISIFLSLEKRENTWNCIFNTNSQLSQYQTEKQIMLFKTAINCLFNDIRCYLLIGCFNWKIGIFNKQL